MNPTRRPARTTSRSTPRYGALIRRDSPSRGGRLSTPYATLPGERGEAPQYALASFSAACPPPTRQRGRPDEAFGLVSEVALAIGAVTPGRA